MKRFISIILAFAIVMTLCACRGQDTTTSQNETDVSDNSKSALMNVDKGLFSVEITIPSSFFKDESEEEIQANAKENGFKKCTINEDGSVTYKMTRAKHKEMMYEMKEDLDELVSGMINGENAVESFKKIEYTDDLSKFDIYVERAKYTTFDALNAFTLYLSGAYYQAFSGKDSSEIDVVVNFIDEATNETIESGSYHDFMDNTNNLEESMN